MLLDKKNAGLVIKGLALIVALAFILSMIQYVAPFLTGSSTPAGVNQQQGGVSTQQTDARAKDLEARLAANPKDFGVAKELGDLYWDTGASSLQAKDTSTAARYFSLSAVAYKKALKLAPGDTNVRTDRATALYYSGSAQEAKQELQAVLKANANHANALFNLGLIARETGDTKAARQAWERYLKVEPAGDRAAQVRQDLGQLK